MNTKTMWRLMDIWAKFEEAVMESDWVEATFWESDLNHAALTLIREGEDCPEEIAAFVLKTKEYDFPRIAV